MDDFEIWWNQVLIQIKLQMSFRSLAQNLQSSYVYRNSVVLSWAYDIPK